MSKPVATIVLAEMDSVGKSDTDDAMTLVAKVVLSLRASKDS